MTPKSGTKTFVIKSNLLEGIVSLEQKNSDKKVMYFLLLGFPKFSQIILVQ